MNSINILYLYLKRHGNVNLYKCVIQEHLWALFKLRKLYFVLSKLQLNCYKNVVFVFVLVFEFIIKLKVLVAHRTLQLFIVVSEPRFRWFYKMILKFL